MLKLSIYIFITRFILIFNIYWWLITSSLILLVLPTIIWLINNYSTISISIFSIIDTLSITLISLSVLIAAIIITARTKIYQEQNNPKSFIIFNLLLLIILINCFSASNIINFYIWFEASLIPTILIIINWGYQPERLQARIYLIIYTITASLPIFAIFLYSIQFFLFIIYVYSNRINTSPTHFK